MNHETRSPKEGNIKRRMLLVIGIILLAMLVLLVVATVLQKVLDKKQNETPQDSTPQTIIFYTPDYDEDITKDPSYMQLDRSIYYADATTGVTVSLDEETYGEHGEATELLCRMIRSVIAGDHTAYNKLFSREYLSVVDEKDTFTPQKLYNITLTYQSSESVEENGLKFDRYYYTVEYMIYKNNGTFRTDVGSDAIRKQTVVITNREGECLIDAVSAHSYSY